MRSIFRDYLAGDGILTIMKRLNESGTTTQCGCEFHESAIERILRNYAYTGNLLLQTKFRENHLTKRTLVNHGELPMYHAAGTHEAIISQETFDAVQTEIRRRGKQCKHSGKAQKYPFSGKITCDICGKHYRRKTTATGPVWICSTYNTYGKSKCPSKAIPEQTLLSVAATVADVGEITAVTAKNDSTLVFTDASGEVTVKQWHDRSRSESWTEEMRNAAGEKTRQRHQNAIAV